MTTKNVIGIDPGFTGGWSIISPEYKILEAGRMPTYENKNQVDIDVPTLVSILDRSNAAAVYCEYVVSRPRQAHQFRFGVATGTLHGVALALGYRLHLITPQKWRAGVGLANRNLDEPISLHKERSRALASRIWPDAAHYWKRVTDDGVAEAALISMYGMGLEQQ